MTKNGPCYHEVHRLVGNAEQVNKGKEKNIFIQKTFTDTF